MPQLPPKISPKGFKDFVTKAGRKTWIPDATKKYLRGTGESRYFSYSATKGQAIKALRGMQASGLAKPRLKPELFYRDVSRGQGGGVGLDISKLPASLPKEKFLGYLARVAGDAVVARARSLMGQWAMSGRGEDARINQNQMGTVLRHLDVHTPNVGKEILRLERRRQANVRGVIEQEVAEEERKLGIDPNADRLPKGVMRSAGRPAASSALRSALRPGGPPPASPSLKNPLRPVSNLDPHPSDQPPGAPPAPAAPHPTLDLAV